jgi:SHS2 domain-containing protein
MSRMFELFEHTADLGLRVHGATLEELLTEAARGLLAMLVANPQTVNPVREKIITLVAGEPSYLLFDWLNELLYAFETEKLLLCKFEIELMGEELRATCHGEPMDVARHEMDHEVKAITYHGLRVEQTANGWEAEVIVDI